MIGNQHVFKGQKAILRDKCLDDIPNDYAWRCDPELARYDATAPLKLSIHEYTLYFTEELRHPRQGRHWFAIDSLDGKHIGNCMYYDIDWQNKSARLGIIIGDREFWGKGYGTDAVSTLVNHIFDDLRLEAVLLETLDWNARARRCFQKCGFMDCGSVTRNGNHFVVMDIRKGWVKQRDENIR